MTRYLLFHYLNVWQPISGIVLSPVDFEVVQSLVGRCHLPLPAVGPSSCGMVSLTPTNSDALLLSQVGSLSTLQEWLKWNQTLLPSTFTAVGVAKMTLNGPSCLDWFPFHLNNIYTHSWSYTLQWLWGVDLFFSSSFHLLKFLYGLIVGYNLSVYFLTERNGMGIGHPVKISCSVTCGVFLVCDLIAIDTKGKAST